LKNPEPIDDLLIQENICHNLHMMIDSVCEKHLHTNDLVYKFSHYVGGSRPHL